MHTTDSTIFYDPAAAMSSTYVRGSIDKVGLTSVIAFSPISDILDVFPQHIAGPKIVACLITLLNLKIDCHPAGSVKDTTNTFRHHFVI